MNWLLFGILCYVALQVLVGLVASRFIKTETDYLLAGRRLGYVLATFSIFATWFGAETCIGSAGEIYSTGLSAVSHDPVGYSVCLLLMGALLAARLWKRQLVTLADLFRQRYSAGVERLVALIIVPTSIVWAAAQIRAFGQVLSASSELDLFLAMTFAAVAVTVYSVAGGLLADAFTDLLQAVVVGAGLIIIFFAVASNVGDPVTVILSLEPERLALLDPEKGWLGRLDSWAIPICGSLVAQELISRVLASRSAKVAQRSCYLAVALYLPLGLIPVYLGLIGTEIMPGLEDPEQLLPSLAQRYLSTAMYIIFAGALVSAILSTVDSALLAGAALISENLVASVKPSLGPVARLRVSRTCVLLLGITAYLIALASDSIYNLVDLASALGSAGVFVVVLLAMFTRIGGPWSAIAGLLAGLVLFVVLRHVEVTGAYVCAVLGATGAYLLVALFEHRPWRPRQAAAPAAA